MIDFRQIYEGWRNNLFPPSHLKEQIEKVGEERISICNECEHNSKFHKSRRPDEHCMKCGCTLSAKTKCLSCNCPVKKWVSVLTRKEEDELNIHEETTN